MCMGRCFNFIFFSGGSRAPKGLSQRWHICKALCCVAFRGHLAVSVEPFTRPALPLGAAAGAPRRRGSALVQVCVCGGFMAATGEGAIGDG